MKNLNKKITLVVALASMISLPVSASIFTKKAKPSMFQNISYNARLALGTVSPFEQAERELLVAGEEIEKDVIDGAISITAEFVESFLPESLVKRVNTKNLVKFAGLLTFVATSVAGTHMMVAARNAGQAINTGAQAAGQAINTGAQAAGQAAGRVICHVPEAIGTGAQVVGQAVNTSAQMLSHILCPNNGYPTDESVETYVKSAGSKVKKEKRNIENRIRERENIEQKKVSYLW